MRYCSDTTLYTRLTNASTQFAKGPEFVSQRSKTLLVILHFFERQYLKLQRNTIYGLVNLRLGLLPSHFKFKLCLYIDIYLSRAFINIYVYHIFIYKNALFDMYMNFSSEK